MATRSRTTPVATSLPPAPNAPISDSPNVAGARPRQNFAEWLINAGLASRTAVNAARAQAESAGKRLAPTLVQCGVLNDDGLAHALSGFLQVPFQDLSRFEPNSECSQLMAEPMARRYRALLLAVRDDGSVVLGMSDPTDVAALDDIEHVLDRRVHLVVCNETQLLAAIDLAYRRLDAISDQVRALEKDIVESAVPNLGGETRDEAPVARLLQTLLEDAVQVRASDIHIEPQESALQIRFRIDGVLVPQAEADGRITAALTQRIKLMAGLDIAERRLPMDGRFSARVRDRDIDVRLSTLPGQRGESLVLRMLDHSAAIRGLDSIGMPAAMAKRLREFLQSGSGMILVTGPTGSGKTTTLYAALSELDRAALKVVTVEDPVEYRLPGIVQVQVNDKIELDFARVLRATLRQDPDVVLVGEMRDNQTVEIGLRAALTGHLVLSTLHTRDAPSAMMRLLDMGAPRYMVATSLRAVLAQRLIRLNCVHCLAPHEPSAQERGWLMNWGGKAGAQLKVKAGQGCMQCNGSGYRERTGIYEMFVMDTYLVAAAVDEQADFLKSAQDSMLGHRLADHAYQLVRDGKTSVAEAMRVSAVGED